MSGCTTSGLEGGFEDKDEDGSGRETAEGSSIIQSSRLSLDSVGAGTGRGMDVVDGSFMLDLSLRLSDVGMSVARTFK